MQLIRMRNNNMTRRTLKYMASPVAQTSYKFSIPLNYQLLATPLGVTCINAQVVYRAKTQFLCHVSFHSHIQTTYT